MKSMRNMLDIYGMRGFRSMCSMPSMYCLRGVNIMNWYKKCLLGLTLYFSTKFIVNNINDFMWTTKIENRVNSPGYPLTPSSPKVPLPSPRNTFFPFCELQRVLKKEPYLNVDLPENMEKMCQISVLIIVIVSTYATQSQPPLQVGLATGWDGVITHHLPLI